MMCSAAFNWASVQFHVAGQQPFMGLMTPENEALFLGSSVDLPCPAVKLAALASDKPKATNMEVMEVAQVMPIQHKFMDADKH